jgi:aspartokinase-like uncharacterized kinase
MNLKKLVIVTNVDGVKPSLESSEILPQLSTKQLRQLGETCLDAGFEDVIDSAKIECVVLKGASPDRLKHFLQTGEVTVGTRILSSD